MKPACVYCEIAYIVISLLSYVAASKRYDVETEAIKLYGENLDTVLLKFRRTPEYLLILTQKVQGLHTYFDEVFSTLLGYSERQIVEKVNEVLGIESGNMVPTTKPPSFLRSHSRPHYRRNIPAPMEKPDTSLERIQRIEKYDKLSSNMTVLEKRNFRDMGFKFAGYLIHGVIEGMGPDDEPAKSTRNIYGSEDKHGKHAITTTEHVHVHEVTQMTTSHVVTGSTVHKQMGTEKPIKFFRAKSASNAII